jgi:hypothetical protein
VYPNGDIGEYFKQGNAISLFVCNSKYEGKIKSTAGVFYTKLAPRMDTVPVYGVQQTGSSTLITPGYLVDHKFYMLYLYVDFDVRIFMIDNLSIFAGVGLGVGKAHVEYDRGYETVLTEQANNDVPMGDFRLKTSIDYEITPHFDAFFRSVFNFATATDWSSSFKHYTFGAGFTYYIKERK